MSEMAFKVQDEPGLGPRPRRYLVTCDHGTSSAVLLPGRQPLADRAVFQLLVAGHHSQQRCECVPGLPRLVKAQA